MFQSFYLYGFFLRSFSSKEKPGITFLNGFEEDLLKPNQLRFHGSMDSIFEEPLAGAKGHVFNNSDAGEQCRPLVLRTAGGQKARKT